MEQQQERRHSQRRQLVDRRTQFRWGPYNTERRQSAGRRSSDQFKRFMI